MSHNTTVEQLWQAATPEQQAAMRALEARGFEFLVHFGRDNAIAKLSAEYQREASLPDFVDVGSL